MIRIRRRVYLLVEQIGNLGLDLPGPKDIGTKNGQPALGIASAGDEFTKIDPAASQDSGLILQTGQRFGELAEPLAV